MSNTSKFVKAFDVLNPKHVEWLSHMCDVAETIGKNMAAEINKNPLSITVSDMDVLDWPHVHFCLCAVYAKAVLRKKAFIP